MVGQGCADEYVGRARGDVERVGDGGEVGGLEVEEVELGHADVSLDSCGIEALGGVSRYPSMADLAVNQGDVCFTSHARRFHLRSIRLCRF